MAAAQPKPGTANGPEPVPLEQPRCEVQQFVKYGRCLVARPDHRATVTDIEGHGLFSLMSSGHESETKYTDTERVITGLILQDNELLVLREDGYISRRPLGYGESTANWQVDVDKLVHGAALGQQLLVCLDGKRGEVFTVSLQADGTLHKRVKLQGRDTENARVACTGIDDGVRIALAEPNLHRVEVYNAKWKLHTTIGGQGGELDPQDCVFLPWGNLLVADTNNDRVSEYRLDARDGQSQLVRHWLIDPYMYKPRVVSFLYPHLWILQNETKTKTNQPEVISRFEIFK